MKADNVPAHVIQRRGYPRSHGGFETAVRMLAPQVDDRRCDVTVYSLPRTASFDDPGTAQQVRESARQRIADELAWGLVTQRYDSLMCAAAPGRTQP